MKLTADQQRVLESIAGLGREECTSPVTIGAIHHTFSDMDVRDLVRHLQILLDMGLIANARQTPDGIGNTFLITAEGIDYYRRNSRKNH